MHKVYFHILVVILLGFASSTAFAIDNCEAEITNNVDTDPAVIMTEVWAAPEKCDPMNPDQACKVVYHDNGPAPDSTIRNEAFQKECDGEAIFAKMKTTPDYGSIGTESDYSIQMVFFAQHDKLVGPVPDEPTEHDYYDIIIGNDGALTNWKNKFFSMPSGATIDTSGRVIYLAGYPFFIPIECIGANCDGPAYNAGSYWSGPNYITGDPDWTRAFLGGYLSNKYSYKKLYSARSIVDGLPFIGVGDKWTGDSSVHNYVIEGEFWIWAPDYTSYKEVIKLNGVLTVEGNGILVLKNVHIKLGPQGRFNIKDKARLVISESIIEYDREDPDIKKMDPSVDGTSKDAYDDDIFPPMFTFTDIKYGNPAFSSRTMDVIPANAPPLLLYFTKIYDAAYYKVSGSTDSKKTLIGNEDSSGEIPTYNPWSYAVSRHYLLAKQDDSMFDGIIKCKKPGEGVCVLEESVGRTELYRYDRFHESYMDAKQCDSSYGMDSHGFCWATKSGQIVRLHSDTNYIVKKKTIVWDSFPPKIVEKIYKVEVVTPSFQEVIGRQANPGEELTTNSSSYQLACTSPDLEIFDPSGAAYCACKIATYVFDAVKNVCKPTAATIEQSDDPLKNDQYVNVDGQIVECDAEQKPNATKDGCVDCLYYQHEYPAEDLRGQCLTIQIGLFDPPSDVFYKDHSFDRCDDEEIPQMQPSDVAGFPSSCAPCLSTQDETQPGKCKDLACDAAQGYAATNHECGIVCTNSLYIYNGTGCVPCDEGTQKVGNECIKDAELPKIPECLDGKCSIPKQPTCPNGEPIPSDGECPEPQDPCKGIGIYDGEKCIEIPTKCTAGQVLENGYCVDGCDGLIVNGECNPGIFRCPDGFNAEDGECVVAPVEPDAASSKSGCSLAGGGALQIFNVFQYIVLLFGVGILRRRNYKS